MDRILDCHLLHSIIILTEYAQCLINYTYKKKINTDRVLVPSLLHLGARPPFILKTLRYRHLSCQCRQVQLVACHSPHSKRIKCLHLLETAFTRAHAVARGSRVQWRMFDSVQSRVGTCKYAFEVMQIFYQLTLRTLTLAYYYFMPR